MKLVRLDVVPGEFCSSAAVAPPSPQAVEARQLVDNWLATTFLRRADAVESLVERIAALLTELDARVEAVDAQLPAAVALATVTAMRPPDEES